jgi:diguanylate cyclase (GGDEF)-like protein
MAAAHRPKRPLNITAMLQRQPKVLLGVLWLGQLALVAALDYATGTELNFSVFYLLPICFATWFLSSGLGVLTAVLSAGLIVWLELLDGAHEAVTFANALTTLLLFVILVFVLGEVRMLYDRERESSRHDYLTSLPNARAFYELLTMEKNRARRFERPLTLAYIDLDNFKLMNDLYGHPEGDTLLATVGKAMQNSIRETDLAARLGGDEFVLLLPESTEDQARVVLEKLQANLKQVMSDNRWPVTFSIGAITFLNAPDSAQEMVQKADHLMYSVKQSGKNRFEQKVEA